MCSRARSETVRVVPGDNRLLLLYTAARRGWHSFQASVKLQRDSNPRNNSLSAVTDVLVRPRVLGNKGLSIMETKEPRIFPIEFTGPARDTDTFDITIPAGYVVDDLPPAVDADYGFASYHSKTEVKGNLIHYSRTFEVKELSVPVARADELKKFYRIIAGDERNTVVLKAGAQ